jgi:hemoglobin
MDTTLDEAQIAPLLDGFYARVRADTLLGPVFAGVEDWPGHLARLSDFWSSVMLTPGRYKGNPVAVHAALADRMEPAMFGRWLELWGQETSAQLSPATASAMQAKAARIADSLRMALGMPTGKGTLVMPRERVSDRPHRSTPDFDSQTLPMTCH